MVVVIAITIEKVISAQFNMYYTGKFSEEIHHHCLRYTVLYDIVYRSEIPLWQNQFLLYCFRPIEDVDTKRENKMNLTSDFVYHLKKNS